jgi:uncharacterized protein YraI
MSMKSTVWASALAAAVLTGAAGAATPAAAEQAVGYTAPHAISVHLHAGPATRYPIIGTIPIDEEITVHGCATVGLWCDVEWRGDRGWVYMPYLHIEGRTPYFFWVGQPYDVP